MAIPQLDRHGLLPVGTHDCTIQEIENAFCWNPHRKSLLNQFRQFISQKWTPLGIPAKIWVDGSFTRKKENPEDIDLVADIQHLNPNAALPVFLLFMDREQIKKDYKVDFWMRHPMVQNDLTKFFCYAGTKASAELGVDTKKIKGILRIQT